MVENGKGSDFFGYYYISGHNGEVPVRRKTYPINESTTDPVLPQGLRQPQTTSYNQDMSISTYIPYPFNEEK